MEQPKYKASLHEPIASSLWDVEHILTTTTRLLNPSLQKYPLITTLDETHLKKNSQYLDSVWHPYIGWETKKLEGVSRAPGSPTIIDEVAVLLCIGSLVPATSILVNIYTIRICKDCLNSSVFTVARLLVCKVYTEALSLQCGSTTRGVQDIKCSDCKQYGEQYRYNSKQSWSLVSPSSTCMVFNLVMVTHKHPTTIFIMHGNDNAASLPTSFHSSFRWTYCHVLDWQYYWVEITICREVGKVKEITSSPA